MKKKQLLFSYDCKLNTNGKRYTIIIAERDKAIRYVESMDNSLKVKDFAMTREVQGYIII